MDIFRVLILGVVEGLTEFLPISSTGHLIVAEKLLHFRDSASLFTVVVQLGSILAATLYFRSDLVYIAKKLIARDKAMILFARNVFIGLLPAGLLGVVVEKFVGLPDSLTLIATSLIVGGAVLLAVEKYAFIATSNGSEVNYSAVTGKRALMVGLAQCVSLIPGVSRSGATIAGGLLSGLDRKTAAVLSFYLGIPIMLAASALKLASHHSQLRGIQGGGLGLVVGVAASFVSGFLVVKWLLRYIQTHGFGGFALYRIGAGSLLLAASLLRWL
jgi:undecaprenyl-diphosphatase